MERKKFLQKKPNFEYLAEKYENFRKYTFYNNEGKLSFNFNDNEANKEFTKTIMLEEYNIKWDIPQNFLVPGIPSKLNYLDWINSILLEYQINNDNIIGVDVGTGANCIYPLLGFTSYGWSFIASDINPEALKSAKNLLEINDIKTIELKLQPNPKNAFVNIISTKDKLTFTLCNPPFFDINEEKINHPARVFINY